jgi:protein-S-isoprenylcysteine O-methyltransferase Ste14
VPLGFLFAAFFLLLARPQWWSLCAGSAIALTGVWIRAISSGHVKKNEELATTGPYAYTRNPLYFGSIVIAGGFALAALRWEIALALIVLFAAIYIPVIQGEERFLSQHFADYPEYCSRVPRLLPRLWAGEAGRSRFSAELYLKHREYNALLGTLAVIAALAAKRIWIAR